MYGIAYAILIGYYYHSHANQKSPLNPWEQLALGIMSQFPIDYMHVVLLGVTRKLLILWKNGDTSKKVSTKFRLSDKMFEQISTR